MKSIYTYILFGTVTLLLASGCQQHIAEPATPMTALPELERSVFQVSSSKNAIFIPSSLVVVRGGIPAVFELRDGKARLRMIRTGITKGSKVQISSGLTGKEILLADNLDTVFDGSPIRTTGNK